jgi:predicted ATPase/DNA-binding SARP family transcriptional activator
MGKSANSGKENRRGMPNLKTAASQEGHTVAAPEPQSPEATLSLRLFGPFDLRRGDESLPRARTRYGHWLLALLALRRGREVERGWLAGTMWPESSGPLAYRSLRSCLADLRHCLGPDAGRLRSPTSHTLCLDLAATEVDVLVFDAAVARGDPSSLGEAVALYRGPLLEECAEPWALQERQVREQAYLAARERLAALALDAGAVAEAEWHLRLAGVVDPLRESTQRALMQALAAGGSYAAALEVYRELRLRLHREINAEPDPETQALLQQLRLEARAGGRRQGHRAAVGSEGSRGDSVLRIRQNLPAQTTPLLGRENDVAAVQALLRQEAVRLVTLTGPGGTGKTRLGLQVAAELLDDFAAGVCFVGLAPIRDPGLVASTIAQTLGVRETSGMPVLEGLKAYLKDRHLLLLLDNFEQVLEAAPLVAELLAAAPRLKVLVTSRTVLRLRGEKNLAVPPLSLPDPQHLPSLETLTQYAAVELFIQRVLDFKPDFGVTNENAPAVAAICHRLDGLPLAIELAAARIKLFSPQALLARLPGTHQVSGRLPLLIGGARDLPARQQTLRGAIAWSYDLLDESEKTLFRRLAVFAGGCTLEAAGAVCRGELEIDILDGLASLVDKSLLQKGEQEDGEPRFTMLETIREYAWERLDDSGEAAATRGRHLDFFLRFAEEAEPEIQSGAEQKAWLDRLEVEHDNLRAALARSEAQGEGEAGLRLGGALGEFWVMRGHLGEGRERLAELLKLPGMEARTAARAKVFHYAGRLAHGQGDCAAARALFEGRLAISRERGDKDGIAGSLHRLGGLAHAQGDYAAARLCYEEALAISRELGDKGRTAWSLYGLGHVVRAQGEYGAARTLLEEGLAICRALGGKHLIARSFGSLGAMAHAQGDSGAARTLLTEGEATARSIEDQRARIFPLGELGHLARDLGDYSRAAALYRESLRLRWELNDPLEITRSLADLAVLAARQGQAERTARLLGAREAQCEALGVAPSVAVRTESGWALATARSALGEERFAAVWAEGRALSLDQAVTYALATDGFESSMPASENGRPPQEARDSQPEAPN